MHIHGLLLLAVGLTINSLKETGEFPAFADQKMKPQYAPGYQIPYGHGLSHVGVGDWLGHLMDVHLTA